MKNIMKYLTPFLILVAGLFIFSAVVFAGMLGTFWFLKGPSGTLDEAAAKIGAQKNMLRQIIRIAQNDRGLGWVEPNMDIRELSHPGNQITPSTIRDYNEIGALMRPCDYRSLEIERDVRAGNKPKFVRFVVFDYGWFGRTPPVMAEWKADGSMPWHGGHDVCKAVDERWYVCTDGD